MLMFFNVKYYWDYYLSTPTGHAPCAHTHMSPHGCLPRLLTGPTRQVLPKGSPHGGQTALGRSLSSRDGFLEASWSHQLVTSRGRLGRHKQHNKLLCVCLAKGLMHDDRLPSIVSTGVAKDAGAYTDASKGSPIAPGLECASPAPFTVEDRRRFWTGGDAFGCARDGISGYQWQLCDV